MTEKRFTIKEFSTLDAMSSLDVICDNGIELPSSTACDLLNELSDENEQLKSYTGEMEDYLARLEEKNKQLKQPNCRNCIHFSCDNADIYCMKKEYENIPDCNIAKDCDEYVGLYE